MPTNDYFDNATQTALPKGQTARAEAVDAKFNAITTGLDKLPTENSFNRGTHNYAGTSTGTGNAYEVTLAHVSGSYADGQEVEFVADKSNTGAATLNVSTIGAVSLVTPDNVALVANAIVANGNVKARYNAALGRFVLMNVDLASKAAASASASAAATSETNAAASASSAAASASAAAASAQSAASIESKVKGIPFDVSEITLVNRSVEVTSQENFLISCFISDDGTYLYVIGSQNKTIYQYTMSTPFDVTTATYANKSFSVSAQDNVPYDIFIGNNGTKMYMVGTINDTVYQYTLSTAWDISTASYDNKSFSIASVDNDPSGIFFSPDGLTMLVSGRQNDSVYQYTLSTAWDVTTSGSSPFGFSYSAQAVGAYGLFYSDDGLKFFILDSGKIHEYTVTTAYAVNGAAFNATIDISSIFPSSVNPFGFAFDSSGGRTYVSASGNNTSYVYQIAHRAYYF